jgi:squalene-hopene/tetraprenyl-beta-curcumene cyclase
VTASDQGASGGKTAAAAAAARASQILLARQDGEGGWSGRSAGDVTLEAEALLVAEVLGIRTAEITNAAAQQIRSLQHADGRWSGNGESAAEGDGPAAAGDLSASVLAYLALRLAGDSADAYHMAVAAGWIRDAGGIAAAGVLTRTWLALFGLTAWCDVPVPAPELCYLPRRHAASGPAAVALAVIGTLRPVRNLPIHVGELRVGDHREAAAASDRRRMQAPNTAHAAALRGLGQWLITWQQRPGLPPARRPTWPCSIVALHLLGFPRDHPVLAKGLSWLTAATSQPRQAPGSSRPVPVRQPPVLDTTLAIEALADSGVASDHAALLAAGRWLLLQRIEGPAGPGVAAGFDSSGWSFGRDGYPALADTARVLLALGRVALPGLIPKPAIRNATRWLTSMQGRDGSWGGSPVVTAYVVRALATHRSSDVRTIRRGVVWLLRQQQPAGSWPNRGGEGDLAVTVAVLDALITAGVLPTKASVKHAVAWLLRHQNADGGWAQVPCAPGSSAQATACALAALVAAGGAEAAAAAGRAADWLVGAQQPDGGWRDDQGATAGRIGGRTSTRRRAALLPGLLMPLAALGRYVTAGDDDVPAPADITLGTGLPVG